MPRPVIAAGFYGKLPARGDFVRFGLPRDFTDAWDSWLSGVISASRQAAGDAWLPAFLEAPVWRFALPPGLCGVRTVVGLTMPSVDRAGRYFPLSFAAVLDTQAVPERASADAWLNICEDAGRAALADDLDPEAVWAALVDPDFLLADRGNWLSEWWTDGSLVVPPASLVLQDLPDAVAYAGMLGLTTAADEH